MRHVTALSTLAFVPLWWASRYSLSFAGAPSRLLQGHQSITSVCCGGVAYQDPYSVLGLPPGTVDEGEVRAAARRLIKLYHPDVPETGDINKFQAVQQAAQQLLEPGAGVGPLGSAEKVYQWAPRPSHSHSYGSQRAPSSAASPLQQSDFAGSRGQRVDVKACAGRRRRDLRKTPRLTAVTHRAEPETFAKVQAVLMQHLGAPAQLVVAGMPLAQLGFVLEGQGSIGMQSVAEVAMALEEEFGVELLTILVGTWVKLNMPETISTVQDLADFVESKMRQ